MEIWIVLAEVNVTQVERKLSQAYTKSIDRGVVVEALS